MNTCEQCKEFQKKWEDGKGLERSLLAVAQAHVNEAKHVLVLGIYKRDDKDVTVLIVESVILQPPIEYINITFTIPGGD